jgi:uncharacterized protein YgiB involved in biofilm formation
MQLRQAQGDARRLEPARWKMKRSDAVRLALIGVGAGTLIALEMWSTGGEETVAADLFTSPDLCKSSGRYAAGQCEQAYADAAKLDEQKAITYKSREDCEADFTPGGCHEVTAAGSSGSGSLSSLFVPTMAGFLIGRALSTSAPPAEPVYRSCTQSTDPNECRRSSGGGGFSGGGGGGGGFFTRSGYRVSTAGTGSSAAVSSGAFSSAPRSATLSRGGFGARAAAMSARA